MHVCTPVVMHAAVALVHLHCAGRTEHACCSCRLRRSNQRVQGLLWQRILISVVKPSQPCLKLGLVRTSAEVCGYCLIEVGNMRRSLDLQARIPAASCELPTAPSSTCHFCPSRARPCVGVSRAAVNGQTGLQRCHFVRHRHQTSMMQ